MIFSYQYTAIFRSNLFSLKSLVLIVGRLCCLDESFEIPQKIFGIIFSKMNELGWLMNHLDRINVSKLLPIRKLLWPVSMFVLFRSDPDITNMSTKVLVWWTINIEKAMKYRKNLKFEVFMLHQERSLGSQDQRKPCLFKGRWCKRFYLLRIGLKIYHPTFPWKYWFFPWSDQNCLIYFLKGMGKHVGIVEQGEKSYLCHKWSSIMISSL